MQLWLTIIVATLCIQIPNIWAIKKFNSDPTFTNAMFIAACCIPTSFLSTACYAYFYGHSFARHSYPFIAISVYGISLITAFGIQFCFLKSKPVTVIDALSILLIVLGLVLMTFKDEILHG